MGGGAMTALDGMVTIAAGEFAGWLTWPAQGPYEKVSGPYALRREEDGTIRCAFRAAERHLNGAGTMHGGCLMAFADFALASIAAPALEARAVTVSLSGDFLAPVGAGALVEATGEILRAGRLVFVRGTVTADGTPAYAFSGIMRRL